MVIDAICPITWGDLCLTGDMYRGSGFFTKFATVGSFVWMHYPGCADQIPPLHGVSAILSLRSVLISWQSRYVALTAFEAGSCDL